MVNIRVLFQLMKQLLMLKRKGCCYSCLQKQRKALQLCDKGNWIPYFIFNSIHLFHEKLIVKHLSGHCREIFFSKRKQDFHHFERLLIFYLHRVTKTRTAPESPHRRCQNGHSWGKMFCLMAQFFFFFQRIVVYRRVRRYLENSVQRCLFLGCR